MSTPSAPSPPGSPPLPPPGAGNPALFWLIALGMVVVAATVVVVVWLTQRDGETAAGGPTTASTSTEPPADTTSSTSTTTSPASATTSSTTSTSTSTTTSTTTTTLPAGACTGPGVDPVWDAADVLAEVMGDFDGDGTGNDRFSLVTSPTLGTHPRVDLSYGYSVLRPMFTPRAWMADARTVNLGGPADIAALQIVFDSGRGAYLWAFHDCEIHLLMEPDSFVFGFALVDGLREKRGLACLDDGVRVTWATSADGTTWQVGDYHLLFDPASATLQKPPWFGPGDGPMELAQFLKSPEDDALIRSYAAFDC